MQERTAARADIEPSDPAPDDDEDDEAEDDDAKAQNAQEMLDLLHEDKESNNGRYSDQYIIDFFKGKLISMLCQNQGFILDGFPKTYEQAKQLFARKLLESLTNYMSFCIKINCGMIMCVCYVVFCSR